MTLFISTHYDRLLENGIAANRGLDHYPVTKITLPGTACAWLLTEIRPEQNYRFAYGLADYGYDSIHEGYINLEAVFAMCDPLFGDRVKVDMQFAPKHPLSVYLIAAKMQGYITDDERHLEIAQRWQTDKHETTQRKPVVMPLKAPSP